MALETTSHPGQILYDDAFVGPGPRSNPAGAAPHSP